MKKSLLSMVLVLGSYAAFAQSNNEKSYTLPVVDPDKPVLLDVELRHGKVTVQGGDYDSVKVVARTRELNEEEMKSVRERKHWRGNWNNNEQMEKTPRSRDGLKSVRNAMLNMQIEQDGNKIEITSEKSTYYVDLVINVPKKTNVNVDMYRGDGIVVNNTDGYLELQSWRGDIVAENVNGPIVAETHQNSIIVSFQDFDDTSPSSLTTHSGDIDITIAQRMAANVNVQSYQGEILSGIDAPFTPTEKIERSESGNKQEIVIGGQLTAKLNNGGQALSLTTYSGDVYVRDAKQ